MIDYSLLKKLASAQGVAPAELLALAPQNDPFYVGAKGQLEKGKWFASIYQAMGSPQKCHIRRVHYWLVTTKAVPKLNGQPYQNTQNDWCILNLGAKYARYLGLVSIENIIDRRNPEPLIHAHHWQHQRASDIRDGIDEDNIIRSIVDQFVAFNPSKTQSHMIELWAEKSTMNDVLEPICRRYGLNLVTGLGELSITAVYLLAKRIIQSQKPVRIFYISDFDPAGESMPLAVSRKIEYFARNYHQLEQADIKLIPLMLTSQQCKDYDLPRTPIKETEKRKDKFEDRHGIGATELDALEALHPGEMSRIITQAVEEYFDTNSWNAAIQKNRELQAYVRAYLVGGECPECEGTSVFDSEYNCQTCQSKGYVEGKIGTDILTALDTSQFDSYTPPSSPLGFDPCAPCLYDSSLEYVPQIERYRAHKSQGSGGNDSDTVDLDLFKEE